MDVQNRVKICPKQKNTYNCHGVPCTAINSMASPHASIDDVLRKLESAYLRTLLHSNATNFEFVMELNASRLSMVILIDAN